MGSMPIITVIPEAVDTTLFQPSFILHSHNDHHHVSTNASDGGDDDDGDVVSDIIDDVVVDKEDDDNGYDGDISSSLLSIQVDQDGLSSDMRGTIERSNSNIDTVGHIDDDDVDVRLHKHLKEAIKKSITKGCVIVYDHSRSDNNIDNNNNNNSSKDRSSSYDSKIVCKKGMKFEFLSIFKWEYRKGWDLLLNAYWTAFKPSDNVVLRLRTYVPSFEG
jgi:hypothetical protein